MFLLLGVLQHVVGYAIQIHTYKYLPWNIPMRVRHIISVKSVRVCVVPSSF